MVSSVFSLLSFFFFCSSHVKVQEADEPKPEHDTLQVPEDAVWFRTLPPYRPAVAQVSVQPLSTQFLRHELRR